MKPAATGGEMGSRYGHRYAAIKAVPTARRSQGPRLGPTCVSDCDDSYSGAARGGEGLVILQRKRMGRERVHMETPGARDN